MAKEELSRVLDYVLNKASLKEVEVILKACERRQEDELRYAGLGGLNPEALAGKMAEYVQGGVEESMEGLRLSLRDYVERIIRQKEPGLSSKDMKTILDNYLPDRSKNTQTSDFDTDMNPELLAAMVRDFCDFSLGKMLPSKQKELWDYLGDWKTVYWKAFPPSIKALIKAFLEDRIGEEEFWTAIFSIAGM